MMAFVDLMSDIFLPASPMLGSTSFGVLTLNATGHTLDVIFDAPKTGTFEGVEFGLRTVTQAPANGLEVSFQDVTDAATPSVCDGTADQYKVVTGLTSNSWVQATPMTSDGTSGGTKRSVTKGDIVGVRIKFASFIAGDSLQLAMIQNSNNATSVDSGMFPYNLQNGGAQYYNIAIVLKYSDGTYCSMGPDFFPASAINTHSVSSSTTPDEVGNKFILAVPLRVSGLWAWLTPAGDFDFVLTNSAGTTIATASQDKDRKRVASTTAGCRRLFSSAQDLTAGTYYVFIRPSTTTALTAVSMDVNAAAVMDGFAFGQNCCWAQRTDAGSITVTATRRALCGLIASGFSDGGSAGTLNPLTSVFGKA